MRNPAAVRYLLNRHRQIAAELTEPGRLRAGFLVVQEFLIAAVGVLFSAVDDLRVALQSVQVCVAKHLLDQADVTACHLEQGGRELGGLGVPAIRPRAAAG